MLEKRNGITLIALVITIIVLLILAGVTLAAISGQGNIIGSAENAVGKYNNKMIEEQEQLNEVIEYIKNDGKVEETGISISLVPDTTGVTKKVIVTVVGYAEEGIKEFTSTIGDNKTYGEGTKEIVETCEITENGIYVFTIEDNKGNTANKGILIENIIEGTIQISVDKPTPTMENVKVTVTWPSGSETGVKEISKNGGTTWQTVTGETSIIEVSENCTIKARVRNNGEEVITASLTISNIDKTSPTVTATSGTESIKEGDSNEISKYFTYTANGTAGITSVVYTDTSNGNAVVTNTNTLSVGTHIIKCTVTKETGATASATKTIVVEKEDTTPPKLVIRCATTGNNKDITISIKSIEDDVAMPENPIYSYYLKKATDSDSEYKLKYQGTNTSYNPTEELELYVSYIMKVEVADAAGNIGSAIISFDGPYCFAEGTKVLTESGMKNIEEIKVGEKVYAINIDTNQRELKEVTNVIENNSKEIYELTIEGEIVKATPKHKFYIIDKGWTMACELEEGDIIASKEENITINKIKLVTYDEPIKVYNLTVDDFHTYLITEYEVLVHNAGSVVNPGSTYDSEGNYE